MPRPNRYPVALRREERETLQTLARRRDRLAARARIILLADRGLSNAEIGRRVRMSPERVGGWRRRFHQEGISGLFDRPRSGRPKKNSNGPE